MSRRWIPAPAEPKDTVAAALVSGALAAGVGVVTFYLVRTILARESLDAEEGSTALTPAAPGEEGRGRD